MGGISIFLSFLRKLSFSGLISVYLTLILSVTATF